MEFRVLGPVAVRRGDRVEVLSGRLQRILLGVLLARVNQPVPVDALANALWGDRPDPRVARKLQLHIHRLRGLLDDPDRLTFGAAGYRLRAEPDEIDAARFDAAVTAAGTLSPQRTVESLRTAMGWWRGAPFADVDVPALADWARRLTDRRLTGIESLYQAELACGLHEAVIGDLTELVARHPLRERLYGLLMTALYRAGRRSDALAVYTRARRTLVAELGLAPGAELRELHGRILAGDPDEPDAGAPVRQEAPAQLPLDVRGFVGRDTELAELDALLTTTTPVVLSAIAGTAGVGKTALAVRWAHRARDRFPDGQLYVDLRGYGPDDPVSAADALAGFLRALGLDGAAIPEDPAERAARFRSLVDKRRMLVLLDNARTVDQVRPLLGAGCTLVTSRDSLAGLVAREGAHRIRLARLSRTDAVDLLRALLGARADTEPAAVNTLVDRCARLPLALRVAAELVRSRPGQAIATLTDDLADQDALDLLDLDGDPHTAVRAVFSWSYRQLDPAAARVFRLLGVHPGHDIDTHAVAAMTATSLRDTRKALDTLVRAHLVDHIPDGRYQPHDLLRTYAAELAADHDDADPPLNRLFDHYLATASAAMDVIAPDERVRRPEVAAPDTATPALSSHHVAFRWLDAERANLLAATQHAGPDRVIAMSETVWRYLTSGNHHDDAITLHTRALHAARTIGDVTAEANARRVLGGATTWAGTRSQALDHLTRARRLYERVDDRLMQAATLNNIGILHWRHGDLACAADDFRRALTLYRSSPNPHLAVPALNNLGRLLTTLRQYDEAGDLHTQASVIAEVNGNRASECRALTGGSRVSALLGRHEEALTHARRALSIARSTGNRSLESSAMGVVGVANAGLGEYEPALRQLDAAVAMARVTGDTDQITNALNALAATHALVGNPATALRRYHEALAEDGLVHRDEYAHALSGVGDVHAGRGEHEQARDYWRRALEIYRELGMPHADDLAVRAGSERTQRQEGPDPPRCRVNALQRGRVQLG